MVKKIKHMFNVLQHRFQIIIYIEHLATTYIKKRPNWPQIIRINLISVSFELRFIFPIWTRCEIQTGKIPRDTRRFISFIQTTSTAIPPFSENIFDNVYHIEPIVENEPIPIFNIILIKMADEFKTRLKQIY